MKAARPESPSSSAAAQARNAADSGHPPSDGPLGGQGKPVGAISKEEATIIFACAAGVRFIHIRSIRDEAFFQSLQTEPLRYFQWAQSIAAGQWGEPLPLDAGPGYPVFLAVIFKLFSSSIVAAAVAQALLDAASAVLLARIVAGTASRTAGILAGVLWVCFAPAIYYTGELLPVTLTIFLVLMGIAAIEVAPDSIATRGLLRFAIGGILWTLAMISRTELILAWPFVVARARALGGPRAVGACVISLVVYVVSLTGANYAKTGEVTFVTVGGGLNLWIGNNRSSDGINPFPNPSQNKEVRRIYDEGRPRRGRTDRLFLQAAIAEIKSEPKAAFYRLCRKFAWVWSGREIPNTTDIEWQMRSSWVVLPGVFPLGFTFLVPVALPGMLIAWRRKRLSWWMSGTIFTALVVCTAFLSNSRFRAPMLPAIVALAAIGLATVPAAVRRAMLRPQSGLVPAMLFLVGIWLSSANVAGIDSRRIPQIEFNTALLERQRMNLPEAVRRVRAGLAQMPEEVSAWLLLADTLHQAGCHEQSVGALKEAEARHPDDPRVRSAIEQSQQMHLLSASSKACP